MATINIPSAFKFGRVRFWLQRHVNTSLTGGGSTIAVDIAPPLWMMDATSAWLRPEDVGPAVAFLQKMEDGLGTFNAYDPLRQVPFAYSRPPFGAFTATGLITDVSVDFEEMRIEGLTAGQIVTQGDYVHIIDSGGRRFLHQFVADGVATGLGAVALIKVRPHISPTWVDNSVATLSVPTCIMRIVPGSIEWPEEIENELFRASFRAQQVFLA